MNRFLSMVCNTHLTCINECVVNRGLGRDGESEQVEDLIRDGDGDDDYYY